MSQVLKAQHQVVRNAFEPRISDVTTFGVSVLGLDAFNFSHSLVLSTEQCELGLDQKVPWLKNQTHLAEQLYCIHGLGKWRNKAL